MSYNLNEPTPSNNQPNKRNTWIFIGAIALLLLGNIYLFMSRNKVMNQRDEALSQVDTTTSSLHNVQTEYDAALARLDQLTSENAQLDSMINNQDSDIGKMKSQIQRLLSSGKKNSADLKKARVLIEQLNNTVKSYEEQIAELKDQNSKLTDYNKVVTKERDSTVEKNITLQQKVKLGAVLHCSNVRMEPIDLRRGGKKEKQTTRAKRVDIFRVTFDIDDNRIAEDGMKNIYVKIIAPDGNMMSNTAFGSGTTTTSKGDAMNYTVLKQISLKQGEPVKNITVDWHQDNSYQKGNYTIEFYNEGFKIGNGNITLK
jgi:septal ring factor EnvC (AmiA/AmiB activator)